MCGLQQQVTPGGRGLTVTGVWPPRPMWSLGVAVVQFLCRCLKVDGRLAFPPAHFVHHIDCLGQSHLPKPSDVVRVEPEVGRRRVRVCLQGLRMKGRQATLVERGDSQVASSSWMQRHPEDAPSLQVSCPSPSTPPPALTARVGACAVLLDAWYPT
eukprot:103042-Chlamydomonas_euryale.AAC.9